MPSQTPLHAPRTPAGSRVSRFRPLMILVVLALVAPLAGCGSGKSKQSASDTRKAGPSVAQPASARPSPTPSSKPADSGAPMASKSTQTPESTAGSNSRVGSLSSSLRAEGPAADSSAGETATRHARVSLREDSLPPVLTAGVSSTEVTPGEIVEITVEASSDVIGVMLADGIGKAQPLAYDDAEGVWHTRYRAPMRFPSDRLGLSVTATNAEDHWRRIWLFLEPREVNVRMEPVGGCTP